MTSKKYIVSWSEFDERCHNLAEVLKVQGRSFDKILAVTRGGAVPAGLLAYFLNIKKVETISIETYGGDGDQELGEVNLLKEANPDFLKDTLIIDDLVDTGTTFRYLKEKVENCMFVTVYAKPLGAKFADIFDHEIPQDTWVYFPWDEVEEG